MRPLGSMRSHAGRAIENNGTWVRVRFESSDLKSGRPFTVLGSSNWTSQESVDTSASLSGCFEFLRTYAAQMTMATRRIVERI
jgi:hypothetical protein